MLFAQNQILFKIGFLLAFNAWGSLYVEAVVNEVGDRLLSGSRLGERNLIWYLAEKAELEKKVKALADKFEADKDRTKKHLGQLKKLARIRNRLVHYKEPPTLVEANNLCDDIRRFIGFNDTHRVSGSTFSDCKTLADQLKKLEDSLPDPDIVHAVLSFTLDQRRQEINELVGWLNSLKVKQ